MERDTNHDLTPGTREFVKKNWPYALIIGGTVVGAAIWITARYLKEKKPKTSEAYINLKQVEDEVEASRDKTAVLLETGSHLGKIAGDDLEEATKDLKAHIQDMSAHEILDVLRDLSRIEANKRARENKDKKP
jgi:predicted RND superfamily exporter protein